MTDNRLFGTHIREACAALTPATERGKMWLAFWSSWLFIFALLGFVIWLSATMRPERASSLTQRATPADSRFTPNKAVAHAPAR